MEYLNWAAVIVILDIIIGVACVEWAWKKVEKLRDHNAEIHSKYSAFRRLDVAQWKKWKFLLGSITLMNIRLIVVVSFCLLNFIIIKITTIGTTFNEEKPLTGWRNWIVSTSINISCTFGCFLVGF